MSDTFKWLSPWYAVESADVCAGLEAQLRREISSRHVLHGESVRLVARRDDTDDALFALADGRVAEVHLTWNHGTEEDPRWPASGIFASLDEWARESMAPLHEELEKLWSR